MKHFLSIIPLLLSVLTLSCNGEINLESDQEVETAIHVSGITLDQKQLTIKEGASLKLTPTVYPEDATNKRINWSSTDDSIAKVDDGIVTAIKAGVATIIATTEDGGKTAMCSIVVESNLAPAVTVGTDHLSAVSVVLMGKANLGTVVSSDLKIGFQYSKSAGILPANSMTVDATEADSNYNFSTGITGLNPETTYYYRSFVRQNGIDTYGETKAFTTKELSSLLHTQEASSVSSVSAKLNANMDLTDVLYENKVFGFYWGLEKDSLKEKVAADEETSSISAFISTLTPAKEYFFQAFVVLDVKEHKEEILSFTTRDVESLLSTLDATDVEAAKANLNARLDLTDVRYDSLDYGFLWGISEESQNNKLNGGELADNVYSASLSNLSHQTQYWYKAYVTLDRQTFSGSIKNFTTGVVPVESVSLDKSEYTFNTTGNTLTLKPTVLPLDATNKSLEWSSDREDIATVDANGRVRAVGNGTATITVTTIDQRKTSACVITVAQWATGVSLNKTSLTLNEGDSQTLIATVLPDNTNDKKIDWTSSNRTVATVDENGIVTAVSKGTATIKATTTDGSGKYASCSVTVKRLVSSITLDKSSVSLFKGETITIIAAVKPSDANNIGITWQSSDASIASVSNSGVVTANIRGNATITVTAKDGSGVSATCEVEVKQPVTGIALDQTSIILNEGQSQTLIPTITPVNANDKTLTWTSSDKSIATVDDYGKVTAVSKGSAIIKATANDGSGKYASCAATVQRLVSAIELSHTSLSIFNGESTTLKATVIPSTANNTSITWKSSDTSVATVSSSGVVTGKSRGNATITVTTNDGSGIKATCEVEVKQPVTSITLSKTSLTLNEGQEQALSATVNPDNSNDKTLKWTSSDESVAAVDQTGKVMAKSKGTATIQATANDGSGNYASCAVTVKRLISSIQLNKTNLTMYRGSSDVTETLSATVSPSTANNTSVSWTSSDSSVATVSSSGVVTGKARGTATITVTANDGSEVNATCEVEVKQYVTSITLSKTSLSLVISSEEAISVTSVLPDNANDKTYTWSSSDSSIASVDQNGKVTAKAKGSAVIKATANDGGGIFASCSLVAFEEKVDMGIKTSEGKTLFWSTRNLCESGFVCSPEQYGDYYAWGEIVPHYVKDHSQDSPCSDWRTIDGKAMTGYDWASYKWCNGSSSTLTRYNYNSSYGDVDNKTEFKDYDYADDAARQALGGDWRIPTDAEWTELREQCTWTWTTRNGVNGRLVTSKTNGNSIFLPAAGYRYGTGLYGVGFTGIYLSSSLFTDNPRNAWYVRFHSDGPDVVVDRHHSVRFYGRSVRPVSE